MQESVNDIRQRMNNGEWDSLRELLEKGRISRRQVLQAWGFGAAALAVSTVAGGSSVLLAACTSNTSSKVTELLVARPSLWTGLDPDFARDAASQEAVNQHMAPLVRYRIVKDSLAGFETFDPTAFEGVLVESYDLSVDRRTYTFHLRHGAMSVAGNPLTADDVVYSVARRIGINAGGAFYLAAAALVTSIDQVKRIDDYTVSFSLPKPFDTFIHIMTSWAAGSIYDSKLLKSKATSSDPWATDYSKVNAFGFGPFKLQSYQQGAQAVWVANEGFALGAPPIKKMTWQVVPEASSRLSLVEKGQVHIAELMTTQEQLDAKSKPGMVIPRISNCNYMVFGLVPVDVPPLDKVEIRQAFHYVIPYDQIIQQVFKGEARRNWSGIVETVPGADPGAWMRYTTNLDKAKQLITQAGYPNGVTVTLGYQLTVPDLEAIAILIRASAVGAGMTVELKGYTDADFNAQAQKGFNAIFLLKDFFTTQTWAYVATTVLGPTGGPVHYDHGRARSTEFEAAVNNGINVGNDSSPAAIQFWNQSQEIVASDAPMLYVCWVNPSVILRSNVAGYGWKPDSTIDFYRIHLTS